MSTNLDAKAGSRALEVVRGADPGRRFALGRGLLVLGRGPRDRGAIDLSGQEGSTLRPMEVRHASLESSDFGLVLRDLESPGGTFVNRRRVLPGQGLTLQAGDVIQLGSVQLRLIEGSSRTEPPTTPMPAPSGTFAFALADGSTARSWDDFLTLSAQRWGAIRDELTSGRIGAFLDSIGRSDLIPRASTGASADDRLDAWLGSLPTTRAGLPELDVHPSRLVVRAAPGGGTLRRVVQVANVGHRLLRSTARVEPAGLPWLRLADDAPVGPFATVEETSLPIEIAVPDALPSPLRAEVVIEGNGGTRRIAVVLEARATAADPLEAVGDLEPTAGPADSRFLALIGRQSPPARVATWASVALALRLLVGVAGGSIGEGAMTPSGPASPSLARVGLAFAAGGLILGAWMARRRGGFGEIPTGGFAGACSGLVAASAVVAACRSAEPILGSWSTSIAAVCLLWAALGAALAGASTWLAPKEPT